MNCTKWTRRQQGSPPVWSYAVCFTCIVCNHETIYTNCECFRLLPVVSIVIACVSVCLSVNLFCPRNNSSHAPARMVKFGPKIQLAKGPFCLGVDWLWPSRSNLTSFQNSVYMHRFCVLKYLWHLHKNGSLLNCCPSQMIPHIYCFQYTRRHGRAMDRETI